MKIIIDLILITFLVVLIIDVSGIVTSFKNLVKRFLKIDKSTEISLKPFDCSLCMSWWIGLFWLIWQGEVSLVNLVVLLIFSCSTDLILEVFYLVKDLIKTLISKVYEKISN